MKLDPYLTPLTKINLKLIKDLNVRLETIKLLGKKHRKKALDMGLGSEFLHMTPKTQATRSKICGTTSNLKASAQQNINKTKRQPMEWEEIFANHISDKGLISIYIKNSYNSIAKTKQTKNSTNNSIWQMDKGTE